MVEVFIGIGSNLGDRAVNIEKAVARITANPQIDDVVLSSLIDTEPVGDLVQPNYLNGVVKFRTSLSPQELLGVLLSIEKELGRVRTVKNASRTIDLDILLYGDRIINQPDLQIPHPRMWEREFVMRPLLEIDPRMMDRVKRSFEK